MAEEADIRRGEVELGRRRWRWEARPAPSGGTDPASVDDEESRQAGASESAGEAIHFLHWFEFTFRRSDDPEQEAYTRAGIPRGEWGEVTLRSVLRSVRRRTWRDRDGRLWEISLAGWPSAERSTEREGAGDKPRPRILFRPTQDGREGVDRWAGELRSLTEADDDRLQSLLDQPS